MRSLMTLGAMSEMAVASKTGTRGPYALTKTPFKIVEQIENLCLQRAALLLQRDRHQTLVENKLQSRDTTHCAPNTSTAARQTDVSCKPRSLRESHTPLSQDRIFRLHFCLHIQHNVRPKS